MKDLIISGSTPQLRYWVASRPIPGEWISGDQYLVAPFPHGVLVAVVDGIGHGSKAAAAAEAAVAVLAEHAGDPVESLVQRCHVALRKTRGAVMSLATLNGLDNTLSWLGIGNVEAMLVSSCKAPGSSRKVSLMLRGGIVGDRLPPLMTASVPLYPDDLLFFATDGIKSAFIRDVRCVEHPYELIHQIFFRHVRGTDDALLLGAKWTRDEAMQDDMQNTNLFPEGGNTH